MKKSIVFSALAMVMTFASLTAFATPGPHGHKYYSKHQKSHKIHKVQKPHGKIDATYR